MKKHRFNLKALKKFDLYLFLGIGLFVVFNLGLGIGYVMGTWHLSTEGISVPDGELRIQGKGTELIDLGNSPEGRTFPITSQFDFTNEEFHCTLLPNEEAFSVATYSLGNVPIPAGALTMQMDSVEIERVRQLASGSVEMTGRLTSVTKIGDALEESAVVPFRAVMVDGGAGNEQDSLIVTVFYNDADSPLQFGIFGPSPRFGWGRKILTGDISVWYE